MKGGNGELEDQIEGHRTSRICHDVEEVDKDQDHHESTSVERVVETLETINEIHNQEIF